MARPLRIEYPGAWYHVMNRGRRREKIFQDKRDYQVYLDLIGKCFELFDLEVHAYSLMPNHYHLLVHTPRGNLSRAMRHLDGVYTQKYNRRHKEDGALFRGRYKSILIEADCYIQEVVRYIHRNPLKAKLERKVGDHRWTSHGVYLKSRDCPKWLQRNFVLKYFGNREKEALRELDLFVRMEPGEAYLRRMNSVNWPAVLGGDGFKDWVQEKFLDKRLDEKEIPQLRETLREKKIGSLKKAAYKLWGRKAESWQRVRRGVEDPKRRAMIYASRMLIKATSKEIGKEFGGIGHTGVSMQCKRAEDELKKRKGCYNSMKELKKAITNVK